MGLMKTRAKTVISVICPEAPVDNIKANMGNLSYKLYPLTAKNTKTVYHRQNPQNGISQLPLPQHMCFLCETAQLYLLSGRDHLQWDRQTLQNIAGKSISISVLLLFIVFMYMFLPRSCVLCKANYLVLESASL